MFKVAGCTVVGTCGGPEKGKLARELGCHHVIDYRQATDTNSFAAAIRAAAPTGIDMNFENVGGHIFDAAFQCLRPRGRVAVCGTISQYNKAGAGLGGAEAPNHINVASMIYSCQRIEGFLAGPYLRNPRFLEEMSRWVLQEKLLAVHETFFDGIASWPKAFISVMNGAHTGKVVIRLNHDAKL